MRALIAVAFLLLAAALAGAQHPATCRVIHHSPYVPSPTSTYHAPQVRRVVRVDIIQVAQINPAYLSQYNPEGYDGALQSDILAELRRLGLKVEAQGQMIAFLLKQGQGQAPPQHPVEPAPPVMPPALDPPPKKVGAGGVSGLGVLTQHCSACHQAGKLSTDQRFTLLDLKGNVATLTAAQKLKVLTKVYSGQMPPPLNGKGIPAVNDQEYAAIVELFQ